MRVSIDPTKCQGTGYCVALDERQFRLDSERAEYTRPEDFDPALHGELLREAESLCPTGAIRVIESP